MIKNLKLNFKNYLGYTLVELIVVVAVMVVVMGGTFIYLVNFGHREKVIGAKNELIADLNLVRNYAQTRQTPPGFGGNLDKIVCTMSNLVLDCKPNGGGESYISKDYSTSDVKITFPSSLEFSVPKGNLVRTGTTMPVDGASVVDLTVTAENNSFSKIIHVNAVGLIYE